MGNSKSVYFPNLDGIRFIAALLVIINHVEQISNLFGINNCFDNDFIKSTGRLGVCLFFVLSGFLITFLLYKEKSMTNNISLKWFYIRRILRIWPLYFLIIILGLFVYQFIPILKFPNVNYSYYNGNLLEILALFVFFMPNIVLINFGPIPFVAQTWSIGAEEQFYLFWPVLNKYIKNKLVLIVGVFLFFFLLKIYFSFTQSHTNFHLYSYKLLNTIPIHFMCIGAFFSYFSFTELKIVLALKDLLFNRFLQFFIFLSLPFIIIFKIYIPFIQEEYFAFVFGYIIFNAALNPKNIFILGNKLFIFLGKISYGLYMYHPICIVLSILLLSHFNIENNRILLYSLVFILTTVIAYLSYEFLEKYFFKLKSKFKIV